VLYATVGESLGWATAALLDQDGALAAQVISNDREIDERCRELTGMVKERLSAASLDPAELEELVAILQMVPELERSADLAEHIAQRGRDGLGGLISPRARGLIQSMCDVGIGMWQLAARAFAERSRDIAFELNELDDQLDSLSAGLVAAGAAAGVEPGVAAELALVARFYERIGDHAVNLARRSAEMSAPRRLSRLGAFRRRRVDEAEGGGGPEPRSLLARLRRLRILPTDSEFFDLFAESASLARKCGEELLETMSDPNDTGEHYRQIRSLERRGDEVTVEILRRLDASFVTPYDREDIHALAEELDDVLDDMFAAVAVVHQMHVTSSLPEVKQQAEILGLPE
jgi:phosphate transport system protein